MVDDTLSSSGTRALTGVVERELLNADRLAEEGTVAVMPRAVVA